mmetsp:Transcript_15522/g.39314  ORF Transcript_15522/g.39314 Transcript_15522/m.39314 type:complete len:313 (-) Transcript_15522:160-1098(-)
MIRLDQGVEESAKHTVAVLISRVHPHTRVWVGQPAVDTSFECEAALCLFVFQLLIHILCEALFEERVAVIGEGGVLFKFPSPRERIFLLVLLRLLLLLLALFFLFHLGFLCFTRRRTLDLTRRGRLITQLTLTCNHRCNAAVHALDTLDLAQAETATVRNIEYTSVRRRVLAVNAANLHLMGISNGLELLFVRPQKRKLDVNTRTHRSAEVGRARADVAQVTVEGELHAPLHLLDSTTETAEYRLDISTLLHRDDAELVLFVHPHQEGLLVVVENTAPRRPVAVGTRSSEEPVSLLEQEVVSDKLGSLILAQ